jgi:protease I
MKVAILLEDNYQVLELWYPYYRMKEAGIEAILVGTGKRHYKSKEGYPANEDLSIEQVRADEFDGVIIPGGYAPDALRRHEKVNAFVNKIFNQRKMTAAICHGGWVLVSAGILKGRKATGSSAIKDDIENAGATYVDDQYVVDKNLITSRIPDDLPVFCSQMVKFLSKVKSSV